MTSRLESTEQCYSTTGRPRRLTDLQIAEILAWYHSRLTNRQMAKRYGIARGTLENIIRTHGTHYKQAPPSAECVARSATQPPRQAHGTRSVVIRYRDVSYGPALACLVHASAGVLIKGAQKAAHHLRAEPENGRAR